MAWSRRHFLATLGRATAAASLLPLAGTGRPAPVLGVIGAGEGSDYGRGALLGIEEAEHSARLLRRPLEIARLPLPAPRAIEAAAAALPPGIVGAVAALPEEGQAHVEEAAVGRGLVMVDARAVRPESRARPGVFRTGLPRAAYERALVAHRKAGGGGIGSAGDGDGTGAPSARAVLWHADLFRYGAEQLNARYRRRFGAGMNGAAWAGWMAVKALSEAAFRATDAGAAGLREALAGHRAAFDGHKGRPLTFTGSGGTLVQPFYVVDGAGVGEFMWPMEGAQ